jgi:hypothetical protein
VSAPPRPFEIDLEALEALPDAEREQAHSDLRAFREMVEANPLWAFLPHRGEQEYRETHGIPLTGKESRGQVEFLELTPKGVFLGAVVAGNRSARRTSTSSTPSSRPSRTSWSRRGFTPTRCSTRPVARS